MRSSPHTRTSRSRANGGRNQWRTTMSEPGAQGVEGPEAILEAVENGLNWDTAKAYQRQVAEERDRLRLLLEINNAVVSHLDFRSLFQQIASALRHVLQQDYLSVALCDAERRTMRVHALDFPASKGLLQEEIVVPWEEAPAARAIDAGRPLQFDRADLEQMGGIVSRALLAEGIRWLGVP